MSTAGRQAETPPAEIVGVGVIVVDLLATLRSYPQVDTKQDVEESRMQVGGPVPTALAQLARFDRRCHFIGSWSDDSFGDFIETDLKTSGISHSRHSRRPGSGTGHSQVWIDKLSGTRTSVTQRPCAEQFVLTDADCRAIERARLLHLDGWPTDVAQQAARVAKASGTLVTIDTGSPKPEIDGLLSLADVVNAPRRFVEEHLHTTDIAEGAREIARRGPRLVTVTDGDRGAVLFAGDQIFQSPALQNLHTVDSNGAGDVFTAGMLHGVLNDWSPLRMLKFAVAIAGIKCQSLGNRDALASEQAAATLARSLDVTSVPAPAGQR